MKTIQIQIECQGGDLIATGQIVKQLISEGWEQEYSRFKADDSHIWILKRSFVDQSEKDSMMLKFVKSVCVIEGLSNGDMAHEISKYMMNNGFRVCSDWLPVGVFGEIHAMAESTGHLMKMSQDGIKTYYHY